MKKIKIDDIRIDGGTQGREVIDQPTVYTYLENMKEGDIFPAMFTVFDGVTHWLVDGFHRYHAYKLLGVKSVDVEYKPGTQQEAQVLSFGMNGRHGKPRTNEDKRRVIVAALDHPLTKDKTTYEIAKICCVSQPFVAAIRDPEKADKQKKQRQKSAKAKAEKLDENTGNTNPISSANETSSVVDDGSPSDEEIKASELALQADMDMMEKMLASNDPLREVTEENKRLNLLVGQLQMRINGLMNEKNEAIREVKKLQKELDKIKGKK